MHPDLTNAYECKKEPRHGTAHSLANGSARGLDNSVQLLRLRVCTILSQMLLGLKEKFYAYIHSEGLPLDQAIL